MAARIVAGWDGTPAAQNALEWAVRHEPDATRVSILSVEDPSRSRRGNADRDAEQAAEALRRARPGITVTVDTAHGSAEDLLAPLTGPDALLVLGAQDPADRLYGHRSSLAYRVAAAASGPVAVVPVSHDHGRGVVVGVVRPGEPPDAVVAAAREAAARHQRLTVVHAWRRLLDIDAFDLDPAHRRDADDRHAKQIAAMALPAASAYPGVEIVRRVVHGRAEDVLRGQAVGAALLVLGRDDAKDANRRRGTMQTVLLTCLVPVLVVPPAR